MVAETRELLYAGAGQVMSVPCSIDGHTFHAEKPRPWTTVRFIPRLGRRFAFHPDGERLAMATGAAGEPSAPIPVDTIHVIFNALEELRRVAPSR
jgi:hypothetical protein